MYDNQLINQYDATGGLLLRESITLHSPMSVPLTNVCTYSYDADVMSLEKELYMDNCEYTLQQRGSETVIWSSRFNNNEGYALEAGMMGLHQFYQCKDHLGSVRELFYVDNNQITSLQSTQYYADGLPMEESTGQSVAAEKYNGKKYLEMHGYDCSDYGARHYYATIGRFTSVDPLAEKYYSISPYAYCAGNPIMFIDPDGKMIGDYYDREGTLLGTDGINDNKIYLLNKGEKVVVPENNNEKLPEKK
jgi:RHS repeat-associated protein